MNYVMYSPSGRMFLDGVEFEVNDQLPDYQAYFAWRMLGNGPTIVPDPLPEFPRITVTAHALMLVLIDNMLADAVESHAMNSGDRQIRAGFMLANEWHSDCQAVQDTRAALGMSEQACYDLFLTAQSAMFSQGYSAMVASL